MWKDRKALQNIAQEKSVLEKTLNAWKSLNTSLQDHQALLELLQEEHDTQSFCELKKEYTQWLEHLTALELKSFLSDVHDKNNCYVSIHAGAGGIDATDWAGMLQRMYFKWAEQKQFAIDILYLNEAEGAKGVKSVNFLVKGLFAYGYLQAESGVHRLVRISPFDSNARRHTSFAGVFVLPELNKDTTIHIKEEDLRIDTYRAGGAGGQHVNKTESAVRITHLPTRTVVQCQNERSQHANRLQAMKMLQSALYKLEKEKKQSQKKLVESSKKANEWGSQIRSYVLHPYRTVKDHRTQLESSDPLAVLDGKLDPFILAWLKTFKTTVTKKK